MNGYVSISGFCIIIVLLSMKIKKEKIKPAVFKCEKKGDL
jgi:hypothetical protein